MQRIVCVLVLSGLVVFMSSCSKGKSELEKGCETNTPTIRTVTDKDGVVEKLNGIYYIVENNTIDGQLYPCGLAPEYSVDQLPVRFSGAVKRYTQSDNLPCCTELLIISKIAKR